MPANSEVGTSSMEVEGAPPGTVLARTFAPDPLPTLAQTEMDARKAAKKARDARKRAKIRKRQNKPHVAYLQRLLKEMLPEVERREKANNAAYERGEVPPVLRDASGAPLNKGFIDVMKCSVQDKEPRFVSHGEICDALAHDGRSALLGEQINSGDLYPLTVWTNAETATLKHATTNLERLLQDVPFDGGGHHLQPEQRLAIALAEEGVGEDTTYKVKRVGSDEEPIEVTRPAHLTSDIWFNTATPGSGKTASVLISLLKNIVSDDAWQKTQQKWREKNAAGRDVCHLGLVKKRSCDNRKLARVIVALVPDSLVSQWLVHAQKLVPVFRQDCGKGFRIWHGTDVEVRQTTSQVGMKKTMEDAHDLSTRTNRAMLWILVADTKATNLTTRQAPHIAFYAKLYDEVLGTRNTEPREYKPESEVMRYVVINATVKQLKEATDNQNTHPIRRALPNRERFDFQSAEQMAILHHCTLPHWVRHVLARGMRPVMPQGVELLNFGIRQTSLASAINGTSDMVITTIDDLLDHILAGLGIAREDERFLKAQKNRAKAILTRTGVNADGSIAQMLKGAVGEAEKKLAELGRAASSAAYEAMQPHEKRSEDGKARQRKCCTAMARLFQTLHDAIDPNPGEQRCCPISFEPTSPEDVVLMACCANWMSRQSYNIIATNPDERQRRCPFCCGPVGNHGVDDEAMHNVLAPMLQGGDFDEEETPIAPGDNDEFRRRLGTLRDTQFKAGPMAVIEILKYAMEWKGGKGLRVMLTFHYDIQGVYGGDSLTNKVRELIMNEVPGLTSVEPIAQSSTGQAHGSAVIDYQRADDTNRVLIVNTTRGSNSLAGHNLGGTHAVIFDGTKSSRGRGQDRLTPSEVTQAIARALRPQPTKPVPADATPFNPYSMPDPKHPDRPPLVNDKGFIEPPESPHAPKLVIFLTSV